ncbi:MAG: GNAT family N-acetyltransferase [Candidatus Thorarchaeota archaeon]|nr:GNAT family N-acetyltransferase [Candidatus Thorarchaeota archaeon]
MKIRQFESNDTEPVLNLANTHAVFDSPLTAADLAITRQLPEAFILAEQEYQIVGFVFGYVRDVLSEVLANWNVSKVGQVELLVVDPNSRTNGVGTMLLESLLEVFAKNGVDMVTLHCPAEATEAKSLYDKVGFETRAYAMRKRL